MLIHFKEQLLQGSMSQSVPANLEEFQGQNGANGLSENDGTLYT